jgi:hypothetical protein
MCPALVIQSMTRLKPKEAVTLYFEDENDSEYHEIGVTLLGDDVIHA